MPPAAVHLEAEIMGIIMFEREAMDTVRAIITPDMFYQDNYRTIFRRMMELDAAGQWPDPMSVVEKLSATGELEMVGGAYGISKFTNYVVSSANLENHCRVIVERHMQREMIRIGADIHAKAYDKTADVFDLLDDAERSILGIGDAIQDEIVGMDAILIETLGDIERNRHLNKLITGVKSGFPSLDRVTRGFQEEDLIIVGARPSVGKTALALSIARAAAAEDDPVALFSLEMNRKKLALRLLAAESEMLLHGLQIGRLDDAQMTALHKDGAAKLSKMKIFIDDGADLTIPRLRAKLRRLKKKHKIKLAIIDYLQLMTGQGQTREQEISYISRQLKKLAKELKIPIIALSQLSRNIERRAAQDKEPQLADLRESGGIEQDADLVIFLWGPSDDDVTRDPGLTNRRYLKIAKARDGMLTRLDLDFNGGIQVFKEHIDGGMKAIPGGGYKPVITNELFEKP